MVNLDPAPRAGGPRRRSRYELGRAARPSPSRTCSTASATTGASAATTSRLDPGERAGHVLRVTRHDAADRRRTSSGHWFEADPLWFKTAVFYEIHLRGVLRRQRRRLRRLPRADREARLPAVARRRLHLAAADLRRRRCATAATTSPTSTTSTPTTARSTTSAASSRPPTSAGMRVIADLVMNHTSDRAPVVPARARGAARLARARLVRVVATPTDKYEDARIIFTDTETSNWTWDDGRRRLLLAPLLLPPARPQLRQPRGPGGDARRPALLARPRARRLPPRRRALPLRARGHQRREPARDARLPQAACARRVDAEYPDRVLLAEANQWPEDVVEYFGDGDECHMALPLPGDAAHVHGDAPRGGHADRTRSSSDARRSPTTASGACSCATTTS